MNPSLPPFRGPGGPGIFRDGPHGGPGSLGWTLFALELVAIAGIAWLLLSMFWNSRRRSTPVPAAPAPAASAPLETLHMRYARGELTRDEYLQARDDLGPGTPASEQPTQT